MLSPLSWFPDQACVSTPQMLPPHMGSLPPWSWAKQIYVIQLGFSTTSEIPGWSADLGGFRSGRCAYCWACSAVVTRLLKQMWWNPHGEGQEMLYVVHTLGSWRGHTQVHPPPYCHWSIGPSWRIFLLAPWIWPLTGYAIFVCIWLVKGFHGLSYFPISLPAFGTFAVSGAWFQPVLCMDIW